MSKSLLLATCFLISVGLSTFVTGAPASVEKPAFGSTKSDCNQENSDMTYDQRQNGTENYRIHVNGVVVLVAPAETVLQAAQLSGSNGESDVSVEPSDLKPKPRPPSPDFKSSVRNTESEYHSNRPLETEEPAVKIAHEVEGSSEAAEPTR